jgi:hypothetical protein
MRVVRSIFRSGRPARIFALGLACVAIAAVWSDAAIAAGTDVSSDQAALTAYHRYVTALVTGMSTGERTARQYAATFGTQCPSVLAPLAALPKTQVNQSALSAFGEEVGGDLAIAFNTEAVVPSQRLSSSLGRLKWSTRRSRDTVASLLSALKASLQVQQSDLCTDARALVAQPLVEPSGTRAFLAVYLPAATLAKRRLVPFLALLGRFQTTSDSAMISSISSLVTQFNTISHVDENALGSVLLRALGLR